MKLDPNPIQVLQRRADEFTTRYTLVETIDQSQELVFLGRGHALVPKRCHTWKKAHKHPSMLVKAALWMRSLF